MARKRRGLSDEDRALWQKVVGSVSKRRHEPTGTEDTPKKNSTPPAPPVMAPPSSPKLAPFKVGERARAATRGHDLSPTIGEALKQAPLRMDPKAFGRMKKGKLVPEARIDLHGMTQDQAHPALTRFIHDAYSRQFRLVLVITGKGKDRDDDGPIPTRRGVLKHLVPHWLATGALRLMVLQVTEAHFRHGGGGAYYVYLRRHR